MSQPQQTGLPLFPYKVNGITYRSFHELAAARRREERLANPSPPPPPTVMEQVDNYVTQSTKTIVEHTPTIIVDFVSATNTVLNVSYTFVKGVAKDVYSQFHPQSPEEIELHIIYDPEKPEATFEIVEAEEEEIDESLYEIVDMPCSNKRPNQFTVSTAADSN